VDLLRDNEEFLALFFLKQKTPEVILKLLQIINESGVLQQCKAKAKLYAERASCSFATSSSARTDLYAYLPTSSKWWLWNFTVGRTVLVRFIMMLSKRLPIDFIDNKELTLHSLSSH